MSGIGAKIRTALADPDENSLGSRMRLRRWSRLLERFPDLDGMNVVDLGGTTGHWDLAPVRPARLTIVNIYDQSSDDASTATVVADACDLRELFEDQSFDLVYSNSVLEHVGGHARRADFAREATRLAPHHWVQTPNRYFPLEPHWLFPFFQFLPVPTRAWIGEHWPLTWSRQTGSDALETVLDTELIGATEFAHLFPGSTILRERVAGVTKSLIATR